jgi:GH25 family lysozyme M1 (1,4-beta-N-acetylmuramidase)
MKKINIIFIICILVSCIIFPISAKTASDTEVDKAMGDSYIAEDTDTVGIQTFSSSVPSAPSGSIGKGVDISYHNGTIDFKKLKSAVDFVIIRCGYGQDLTSQDDTKFETYVKGCRDNNIPYGIYLYSYADTVTKAKSEGEHALRLAKKCDEWNTKPTLPIFYDMEDEIQLKTSAEVKGDMAEAFCNILENAGYKTGIYANKTWWTNYLTDSYFDNVIRWVAQYNSTCTYNKSYAIWQCSSEVSVSGISGKVDLNYMMKDIYIKTDSATTTESISATGYTGTYDTKAHTITITGQTTETEIWYSTDNKNWSTTKPSRTDVGTTTVYYKAINQNDQEVTGNAKITITARKISACSIASISNKTYTGSQIKPTPSITYSGKALVKGKDYSLSYSNNKSTGKATIKITGTGNFSGSVKKYFYIVPKKVTISSAKKGTKKKSATLIWRKVTGATGYQIAYSRKGKNKWSYTTVTSTKKTFTNLNVKSYDVKVRAYKIVNGKKHYGSYSAVKTMTAK